MSELSLEACILCQESTCEGCDVFILYKKENPIVDYSEAKSNQHFKEVETVLDELIDNAKSDGSTASYYQLPEGAKEIQDLISYKNMNAQVGEIFRSAYRYGEASHSSMLRDAKKIQFYINEEIKRLEKYGNR